jgi:hypothetical protein
MVPPFAPWTVFGPNIAVTILNARLGFFAWALVKAVAMSVTTPSFAGIDTLQPIVIKNMIPNTSFVFSDAIQDTRGYRI